MGKKSKNKNRKFQPFDFGNNHPITNGSSSSTVPVTSHWAVSTVKPENTTCSLADIQAEQLIISKQEAEHRKIEKDKADIEKDKADIEKDKANRLKRLEDERKIAEIMSELKPPTMQEVTSQIRLQYKTARGHETSRQMCLKYHELVSNNRIRDIIAFEKYDPMRIWLYPELSKYREEATEIYNKVRVYNNNY